MYGASEISFIHFLPYGYDISRNITLVIALVCALTLIPRFVFRQNLKDENGNSIPPGPALRYPFLGQYPERTLHAWAQQFGSIYSLWMGSQLVVVINDPIVARDLLVVHGANFSSRWNYFIKKQMILRGGAITSAAYDDTWRKHRRIAMQVLTPKAIQGYESVLDYEAHIMVRSLYLESRQGMLPINPASFVGRYALNNMLAITFGTRTDSASDFLVQRAMQLGKEFMDLTGPLSNMVDFIKPLQLLPTSKRARGRKLREDFIEVNGAMILRVKNDMEAGRNVPDCLVKTLLECQESEKLDWADICFLAVAFTTGGVQSMTGIIEWFLAFMPSHPEVQARAHEELDRVVGRKNCPTAEDETRLPYIRAIIKEVLRCQSPFWLGTPHCSDNDFVYNGMYIPRDTIVILNSYSIHHREERYPDSWEFKPERYEGDNLSSTASSKLADPTQRDHWAFGAGRRKCPAMTVAEREIFLAISKLLWSFTIHAVPGSPIQLDKYEGNSSRTPIPFKITLLPRHEHVHDLLDIEDETQI